MNERIVIVGGGVTGALIAAVLAGRGMDVTVIEKAELGNGSSRRSAASIRAQFTVEETVVGMMYAQWYYSRFHEMMQTQGAAQPVIRRNGYLFLYENPESVTPRWSFRARHAAQEAWSAAAQSVRLQQQVGLPVEILTPNDVQSRWPHLDSVRLIGATWCADDGFLDARAIYTRGFERARELGARVVTGAEAVGARLCRGRITSLETTAGSFEADWYINATNAWAPRFSALVGGMPLNVAPMKRYLYMAGTDLSTADLVDTDALPMTILGVGPGRGAFARPVFDRGDDARIQLGWAHDTLPEPVFEDEDQDAVEPLFGHDDGPDNYGRAVLRQLQDFAPKLSASVRVISTECGYYGVTPDHTPLIGGDAYQGNLVHAVGFSGHGLMHAPFTAALVEGIVTGKCDGGELQLPGAFSSKSVDLARFAPHRAFTVPEGLVL